MRYIEPGEGSDREAGLRLLAAEGFDLVIGVGFIFTDDINTLAGEYPERALRRRRLRRVRPTASAIRCRMPPNLAALKFREEEGSFLVGALAALRRQEQEGRLRRRHGHRRSSTSSRRATAPA